MDLSLSLALTLSIQNKRRRSGRRRQPESPPPPSPSSQPPEDGLDRLTALPDPLRLQILSLLPFSDAIRTGALSTKWKNLWKTRHHNRAHSYVRANIPSNRSAASFLRRILKLFKDPTKLYHSLHISFQPDAYYFPNIYHVLQHASIYGVKDISIDQLSSSIDPGESMFTLSLKENFSSLVRLSLSRLRLHPIPWHFQTLSNLESLSLYRVNISDSVFTIMLAHCPVLRSLDLRQCPDLTKVVAIDQRLVNVTVVDCARLVKLCVRVPRLKKFHFKGEFASKCWFGGTEHLEDVYMCCGGPGTLFPTSNWVKEIGGFRHVRVLTLCSVSLQYIMATDADVFENFQVFECLKELQLLMISMTFEDLMGIYKFFRLCQCPLLEKLFIELPTTRNNPHLENLMEVAMEDPPSSPFSKLKMIKINSYKDHEYEKCLVGFLLSRSLNLQSLLVVSPREYAWQYRWYMRDCYFYILQLYRIQFSRMPRLSALVRIIVIEHDDFHVKPSHEAHCKMSASPTHSCYDSMSTETCTTEGKPPKHTCISKGSTPNGVGHLVREFEQRKQAFENDARVIVEVKLGQSQLNANPKEDLRKLKARFISWKKDYMVQLKDAKKSIRKLVVSNGEKPRRKWCNCGVRVRI